MTCRIINSTWKYIDVVRLDPAEDVLVARVNGSTISQPLSPRVTTSMSSGNVVVDFTAVECTDAGNYVCVLNDDASAKIQSPDSVLQVRRPPSVPTLDLNAHQIVGSTLNAYHKHKCLGDVGYPAGEFKVQYAASGSSIFSELSVSNIKTTPSEWLCNSTERTMEFEIDFQADMDGGVIRCDIHNPLFSSTTYSNNVTIELIPGDICKTTNEDTIHHPRNCKKYVTCYNEPRGYTCGGSCVKIDNGIFQSCVECSEDVCPRDEETTTPGTTTVSGPSYLICDDMSGYTGEAAFLQCRITSNDFDTVILSHTSETSTDSVSLWKLTKSSSAKMTTDSIWTDLKVTYHTDGSIKYINTTVSTVACEMSGKFHLNLTMGELSSVTTSNINVLVKPTTAPAISQRKYLDASTGHIECKGEVGNPPVQMALQIANGTSNSSVTLTSAPAGDDIKDRCTFRRTIRSTASLALLNGTDVTFVSLPMPRSSSIHTIAINSSSAGTVPPLNQHAQELHVLQYLVTVAAIIVVGVHRFYNNAG
ncbi:uncharacterized protein LOC132562472 [Ylistrum balloti]|uniref:uncharacterized protein LOC132562472 n=1 Tax=Ylistrum balloti TaxID=509963 RepID=UPI002905F147|nr:uncharacterized protein LOC132562472 [Ylistrum balloti]